ncbi:xanthine dehydrogenase family protein molybdopterin-binding subunit [Pseudonocardia halophobica]|uniref:xanthine dehydrogenase family protein molybdopterin-binding subunit n=1 Tax=Pseudonocardia halophobica TaxID=29401 RepID=UPI003D9253C0
MNPFLPGIGSSSPRLEDEELLKGRARFAADLEVGGALTMVYVRSPVAHARIEGIDATEARAMPGVRAVFTASDLEVGPLLLSPMTDMIPTPFHRPALASDTVRFAGEIVAIVVAETPMQAEDAAGAVEVDLDPLPAVVDPTWAASAEAPLLFPDTGSNVALRIPFSGGTAPAEHAPVTIRHQVLNQRMAVAPMEANAAVAVPEQDHITLWASTQFPHLVRDVIAENLGMPKERLRVACPAVGGGFGGKTPLEVDYILVVAVAAALGEPIRVVQSRSENLTTMHARGQLFEVTLSAERDGRITALEVETLVDAGAYPGIGCGMPMTTRLLAGGAYDIPSVRFDITAVATSTSPVGAFRGAGRPEAISMLERSVDMLAAELDIDPAELRRRNLLRPERFPHTTPTGATYDTGEYERCLDAALERAGYAELRAEQKRRRAAGDRVVLGVGLSFYVEVSANNTGYGKEYGRLTVDADGGATLDVGTSAHGQGHGTVYAQIAAHALGIPMDRIRLAHGDTDRVPFGMGTGGSRSTQVGGSAVLLAAEAVRDQALTLAAHLLEADLADLEIVPGEGIGVRGVASRVLDWPALAAAAADPQRRPEGMAEGLTAAPGFDQGVDGTAPFGCHIAVVEVDTDTGMVDLRRIVAVDDCGVQVNPMLVEGQVHGGLAAGIGQALFEAITYDDEGNLTTASFADYGMPSAADLPPFDTGHTVTPALRNPLGAKGVGEAGTTGSTVAVQNAVIDALAHLGIRHLDLPLTPERVWRAIVEA